MYINYTQIFLFYTCSKKLCLQRFVHAENDGRAGSASEHGYAAAAVEGVDAARLVDVAPDFKEALGFGADSNRLGLDSGLDGIGGE